MKLTGHLAFSIFLILIGSFVVYSASYWSFKTGFFPMAVAIPLVILALAHLLMEMFGGAEKASGPAVETEFANDVSPEIARRRASAVFSWIAAFIFFVFFLGFPLAVPLFVFLYLKVQSQAGWIRSTTLTVVAWVFFYVVFQRVVKIQFDDGVIQSWLGL